MSSIVRVEKDKHERKRVYLSLPSNPINHYQATLKNKSLTEWQ